MRFLRLLIRYIVYTVLVLLAFAGGAVAVLTLTERGRENLAALVSDFVSTPEATVRISGLSGVWSGHLRVASVTLGDAEGAWLVARDVEAEWSPLRLLSRKVEAERVFARRVEVARLPRGDDSGSAGSSLPVSLQFNSIELPEVALGGELAGGVAAVAIQASLSADASPVEFESDFVARRIDGKAGEASGAVHFVPGDNVLDINVRASEPAGGIIANLLRLPGAPPVELSLMGSGPASDWKVSGLLSADGAVVSRIDGRRRLTERGSVVEGKGDGEFARFVPAALQPLLAGKSTFEVAATLTESGGIEVERASLQSSAVRGAASGHIDPAGSSDFTLELAANDPAGVLISLAAGESPVTVVVRSASVRAAGLGGRPKLDVAAALAQVDTEAVKLTDVAVALHSDAFDLQQRAGPVSGSARAAAALVTDATLAPLAAGAVSIEVAGTLSQEALAVSAGRLTSDALAGTVAGTVSFLDGSIALDVDADMASLALPAAARNVLGQRTRIAGKVRRGSDGSVTADPFSLSSEGLTLGGRLVSRGADIDAAVEGSVADIAPLVKNLSGGFDFSGTVKGAPGAPDVALTARSDRLAVFGREVSGVSLRGSGRAAGPDSVAEISLNGTLAGQPLAASAALSLPQNRPVIRNLALTLGNNRASGDLAFDAAFTPEGRLALVLSDVAPVATLFDETASGDATGTLTFAADADSPRLVVQAASTALAWDGIALSGASFEGALDDYLARPALSGRARAQSLTSGTTAIDDIDVALAAEGEWTRFDGAAALSAIPAKAAGRVRLAAGGGAELELTSAEAVVRGVRASLVEPSLLTIADGAVGLEGLTLDVAGATAVISGSAGEALDLNASLSVPNEGLALSFGTAESPIEMVLRSGSIRAFGPRATPDLDIAASLSTLSTTDAKLQSLDISLHADAFDLASRTGPFTGDASAAAIALENEALAPLVTGTIKAALAGSLGLESLDVASGSVSSNALNGEFAGNLSLASGAVTLRLDVDLASAALPVAVRGILAERTAVAGTISRDDQGRISGSGLKVESGPLAAAGSATLDNGVLDASLSGTLQDVALLAPQASGAAGFVLTAKGPAATPQLVAAIEAERIEVRGRVLTGLKLAATGKADVANPAAEVSLSGTFDGQPLQAEASLAGGNESRQLRGLSVTLGPNSLSGDLDLDASFLPTGRLALTIPDLSPLAALAGETVSGSLVGTLEFGSDGSSPRVAVIATAERLERGAASATDVAVDATVADYLSAPALSGRVRAGSLISGATAIDGLDVELSRDGPWTRFDGGLTYSGVPARATGRARLAGGDVAIELASAEATLQGYKPVLAAPAAIRVADGAINFDALRLDVAGGTAVVSGRAGAALDLTTDFSAPPEGTRLTFGGPENAISFGVRSARVRASGPSATPKLDIEAQLAQVSTPWATADEVALTLQSEAFDITARAGPFSAWATATGLAVDNPAIAPLLAGSVRAELAGGLAGERLSIESGRLSSGAFSSAFSGDIALADGSMTLTLDADVAAAALPAAARGVLAERAAISGRLARDAAGNLRAESLSVTSGALTATGTATLTGTALDAGVSGRLSDVGLLAKEAEGAVDFTLTARGEVSAPDLSLTVNSEKIVVAGRQIDNLKLIANGRADAADPAADVQLTGSVAGEALDGRARLATMGGRREISGLSLSLGANKIAGDLVLDQDFLPVGTVEFTLPDVGAVAALALETAEGNLNGTIRFGVEAGKPTMALEARTATIRRGGVSASEVSVSANLSDYLVRPTISGRVQAQSLAFGGNNVTDIDVTLTRDGVWTGFDGGATFMGIPARAAGRVQLSGDKAVVELASGQAVVQGIAAALRGATTVAVENGAARLDGLTLDLGGGTAVVSGTAGATLDLTATLTGVPASLANGFVPGLEASGTVSGTARITGSTADPSVGFSVEWKSAETSQTRAAGLGALSLSSTGELKGGRLAFTATIGGAGGLSLSGGGNVDTRSRALALDFDGSVPFSTIAARLAGQGLSLTGAASVSLQVRGTTAAPRIGGSVRSAGARLVDARSGIAVTGIDADIALSDGRATVRALTGTLSTGGSVTASGAVGIDPGAGFPADLAVRIADARYTDGQVVTSTLSGNLAVKGPLASGPTLSGTLDLAKTVITVPERLPGSIANLGVTHKNAPAKVRRQEAALRPAAPATGSGSGLILDVTINAPSQIFVQGRGLDAELGGSVRLTGPLSAPQALGRFELRRGRLLVLSRRLTFTRGLITFAGSIVPTLDLAADSVSGDTTVTVTVSGPANDPDFDFTSNPPLPEDEVLARLIFGRSMSNLSPLQIAQLAEAAAQLAGVGGSTTLLETLRSNLGVDDLDIRTDETGGTTVGVGKYLNDRTYLSLEKGDRAGSGRARIDLDVGRGVKLRGEATEAGEAKGGIFFEREY